MIEPSANSLGSRLRGVGVFLAEVFQDDFDAVERRRDVVGHQRGDEVELGGDRAWDR